MMRLINKSFLVLSAMFSLIGLSFAADFPSYKDGLLTIPSVDTVNQVGAFQDVTFKLTDQGVWQLLSGNAIGTSSIGLALVEKVEVVKIEYFPVQVFLRVSGGLSACSSMGQVNQRLLNNQFDITITTKINIDPKTTTCTANVIPFVKTISLPVYGLGTGIYSYSVNANSATGSTGTFQLTADNRLPGDY